MQFPFHNGISKEITMSRLLAALALGLFACGVTYAADKPLTPQQEKMKSCNKEAEGKKGDERKKFMSECLKKDKPMSQQDKMKACNKDAEGKKGEDTKSAFVGATSLRRLRLSMFSGVLSYP
jgi:hypothetical protein